MSKCDQPIASAHDQFKGKTLSEVIQDVERNYICGVLNHAGGNKRKAAALAGLEYQTFQRRLKALNLTVTYSVD